MKRLSVILIVLFINCCYAWSEKKIIYPYQSACPNEVPNIHQKTYPCNWEKEILHWDSNPMIFFCTNVPQEYYVTYNITSLIDNGIYGYSVSVWEHFGQRSYHDNMDQEYTAEQYIYAYFNDWRNRAEGDWRKREDKYVQPLNGDYAYDFSPNDHQMPLAVFDNKRLNPSTIGIYIERETITDRFPCFYMSSDISII